MIDQFIQNDAFKSWWRSSVLSIAAMHGSLSIGFSLGDTSAHGPDMHFFSCSDIKYVLHLHLARSW